MTLSKKLLRRTAILLQLQAAYPAALPFQTLMDGLKLASMHAYPSEDELRADCEYLAEKNFLTQTRSEISPSEKRFKISAKGLDFLTESGF